MSSIEYWAFLFNNLSRLRGHRFQLSLSNAGLRIESSTIQIPSHANSDGDIRAIQILTSIWYRLFQFDLFMISIWLKSNKFDHFQSKIWLKSKKMTLMLIKRSKKWNLIEKVKFNKKKLNLIVCLDLLLIKKQYFQSLSMDFELIE